MDKELNDDALSDKINRLTDEVNQLRSEKAVFHAPKFALVCRGCGQHCPATPEGLAFAGRHDDTDECGRRTDREAEGWNLVAL